MKRFLVQLALAAALSAATAARADLHRLVLDGQVHSGAGTRPAQLRLLCDPATDGGAISVELWVPQAATLKDFDYDDFEGPDAAAGSQALSHVSLTGSAGTAGITYAAAGWYSGEDDPNTFVFGVSQRSHRKGKVATLLSAVDVKYTQLVWVQNGFKDRRELRATFTLDPELATKIHATVDSCLAPAKSKPAPSKRSRPDGAPKAAG
jgi:hypothetical protein